MRFVAAAFAAREFGPAYPAELHPFFVPASGPRAAVGGFSV